MKRRLLWISDSPSWPSPLGRAARFLARWLARRGPLELAVLGWRAEPPRHTVPYRTFVPGSRPWDPDRVAAVVRSFRPEVVVTLGEFPHLLPLVEVLAGRTIWIGALAEAAESASPLWADLLEALDWCLLPTRRACRAAQTVVPSARVQVMPLGVEAAVFRPLRSRHRLRQEVGLENSFVLGCLAPNQTRVQWPQILDALAPFGRAHEEVFLYLHTTPDGPAWDLIDLLRRRGLLAQAGFTPELTTGKPLPDEDLNEIYNLLDVVVVLDSSDALGLTLWEAQAAGVPVVALATSTAQERLGRQGPFVQVAAWWTDPVTEHAWPLVGPESLREQLEALYRDVAWRSALRRQGRRRARGHSWEGAIRAWSDLLETALSLAPRHRRPAGERVLWARRDGGMGDVIFALSALVARQAQEPELRIEFCTRPEHVAWVRWFDWLHCVSPSQAPPKGAEVVDFNRFDPNFPGDRARGMGYVLGAPVAELVMPPCIPPRVRERATRWLPEERSGRLIGFAPCADRRPPGRSWSLAQITRFLDLIDPEDTILLFDRKPLPLAPRPNLINTSGQLSQVEALALLSHCEAFVGLDSGLLYAAAMFRIPILGLFTHISPLHRLGTTAAFIALCPSLPCAPCGDLLDLTFGCTRPWGREFACVQLLRPEVAAELLPRLFTHPPPRQVVRLDSAGRRTEWDLEPLAPSFRGELTSIVVLNHNTWRSCTRACLEHLRRTTVPPYEIVLVDNGSDPAEVEQIHRELPPGVKLVLNPYNWGFPRGVNRGLERVSPRARLVCLLNSDCYVQERCWNQKVRRLFDDHWRWGAVSLTRGERRYFLDGETGEEYSYPEADAHTGECEIINGACLVVDRSRVGEFRLDESFSPGCREDDDLSFQIRAQGWAVAQVTPFNVVHLGGKSFAARERQIEYEGQTYSLEELLTRNRQRLLQKWAPMLHPRGDLRADLAHLARFYRPQVSVVLCAGEGEPDPGSLASVEGQTLSDWELLIVVSSAEQAAALGKKGAAEPRWQVLEAGTEDLGRQREVGLQAGRGLYRAFLDCPDVWHPEHLYLLVGYLDRCPEVGMVYSDAQEVWGRLRGKEFALLRKGKVTTCHRFVRERFAEESWFLVPSAVLMRAGVVEQVEGADVLPGTKTYWLRVAERTRVDHFCSRTAVGFPTVEHRRLDFSAPAVKGRG